MFNTFLKNRARTLTSILILSILLTAATVFAALESIEADKGGVIEVSEGVRLVISPGGLAADAEVLGVMNTDEDGNISFTFLAYEEGDPEASIALEKPALLYVSQDVVGNAGKAKLYGENGEVIKPERSDGGLIYSLDHFSLYYYRRR